MKLRSAVKKKQRLKESERLLVHTFDRERFVELDNLELICKKGSFSCKTEEKLSTGQVNEHGQNFSCNKYSNYFDSNQNLKEQLRLHEEHKERTMFEYEICRYRGTTEQSLERYSQRIDSCVECKTLLDDVYE